MQGGQLATCKSAKQSCAQGPVSLTEPRPAMLLCSFVCKPCMSTRRLAAHLTICSPFGSALIGQCITCCMDIRRRDATSHLHPTRIPLGCGHRRISNCPNCPNDSNRQSVGGHLFASHPTALCASHGHLFHYSSVLAARPPTLDWRVRRFCSRISTSLPA